jgi:HK97 gp10 family phage protein
MIHAKLEGVNGAITALESMKGRATNEAIGRIVRNASKPIVASARARVPVDSGLLRNQIGFITANDSRFPTTTLIGVNYRFQGAKRGNSAYYAHIVEYGGKTINRAPHPFMRPAFQMNEARVRKQIMGMIKKLLNIKETK